MKYELVCIDKEGDKLKLETSDGIATLKESNKFTIPISSEKIKRLVDGLSSIAFILSDFGLKEISIKELGE